MSGKDAAKDEEVGLHEERQTTGPREMDDDGPGFCGYILIFFSAIFFILFLPITIFTSIRVVKVYERAIVLRLGRLRKQNGSAILGAGVQFVLPCVDSMLTVDLRTRSINIQPQDVLTRDAVTVNVDAVVYLRVLDPQSALLKVEDATKSSELLAISTLRTVIGNYELAQMLTARKEIDVMMQRILDDATDPWGIRVERVEIKDVSLPQEMQRAMAAEAQATRAAKAKVIAAQGELDASDTLQLAATKMSNSPTALQLRYLQTLATIATEQNSTIIFPLPIELLNVFGSKKRD